MHAVLSTNIDENLAIVGKKHIFVFKVATQALSVLENYRIASIMSVDGNNCYAIVQKNLRCVHTKYSGLKIFHLKTLVDNGIIALFEIENTVVPRNSSIVYSEENQRLVYMKNFETFHIIPPLHRSTIGFIGMLPRHRYLAVKKIQNKFVALDKNNKLTTWNALTGRLQEQKKITDSDYSGYTIFGTHKNQARDLTYVREWY